MFILYLTIIHQYQKCNKLSILKDMINFFTLQLVVDFHPLISNGVDEHTGMHCL